MAHDAADFGRRMVRVAVFDSRRHFAGLCNLRCPVVSSLHRFFIAVARVAVNEDGAGGTAVDPCVCKERKAKVG